MLTALGAAMRARRTCPTCRRDTDCCPTALTGRVLAVGSPSAFLSIAP